MVGKLNTLQEELDQYEQTVQEMAERLEREKADAASMRTLQAQSLRDSDRAEKTRRQLERKKQRELMAKQQSIDSLEEILQLKTAELYQYKEPV